MNVLKILSIGPRCSEKPGQEPDHSAIAEEYKRRFSDAWRAYEDAQPTIMYKAMMQNLSSPVDGTFKLPSIPHSAYAAEWNLSKGKFFEQHMDCRPNPGDTIMADYTGLILPSLDNKCLSELYREITDWDGIPSGINVERLQLFVSDLHELMKYDILARYIFKPSPGTVKHLEEHIHKRKGLCTEIAATLYMLLKKDGFEDVSILALSEKESRIGHVLLKVRIDGKIYLADSTSGIVYMCIDPSGPSLETYKQIPIHVMPSGLKGMARK